MAGQGLTKESSGGFLISQQSSIRNVLPRNIEAFDRVFATITSSSAHGYVNAVELGCRVYVVRWTAPQPSCIATVTFLCICTYAYVRSNCCLLVVNSYGRRGARRERGRRASGQELVGIQLYVATADSRPALCLGRVALSAM